MPVLPDGTVISEEEARRREQEYAEMVARTVGTGIPTTGYDLGTDWNFSPATTGGGTLNLGWEQAPNLSANINFDPTAGWENAFISGSDVSGEGMLDVGTVSSPNATLGFTAGVKDILGPSSANPYMNVDLNNAVSGLDLSAGTDKLPQASFSAGNIGDQGYNLGLQQTSGEDIQGSLRAKLMGLPSAAFQPDVVQDNTGLFLNLSTDPSKTNPSGFEFKGTLDDLGTLGRRVGGWAKDLFSPVNTAGADASVPEIAVAPTFVEDESAWGAGMAEVSMPGSDFFGGGVDAPGPIFDYTAPSVAQVQDVARHGGLTFGIPQVTGAISDIGTHGWVPQWYREYVRDRRDTIGQFLGDETSTDKLQDLINNQIAADMLRQDPTAPRQELFDQYMDNPNVVYDQDSLVAMVDLAKLGHYKTEDEVRDAIAEVKTGVDSFKELSAPPAQTVTRPSRVTPAVKSGPTHVPTQPAVPAYTGPTRAELKAAAVAQRKADSAAQKAAARRTALARQALKDSQAAATRAAAASAAQAKSEQAKARAVLAAAAGSDRGGPSQRDINAAIEVLGQVDTFASGNPFAEAAADRASVGIDASGKYSGGGPF